MKKTPQSKSRTAKKAAGTSSRTRKPGTKKSAAAKSAASGNGGDLAASWPVAVDSSAPVKRRVAAIADAVSAINEDDAVFQGAIALIRDRETPAAVRLAALQAVQAASFGVGSFSPRLPDYLATLREVAVDPDRALRQRALGILARTSDGYAQQLLLDGLDDPSKAMLPPERALQLLSYDTKTEAYAIARRVVGNPPNAAARHEAMRLLAADAKSVPLFEKTLADKKESTDIRKLSALALNTLAPAALRAHARKIVLDESDDKDMRATCLTALTDVGDEGATAKDKTLYDRVDAMKASSKGVLLKGAKRFLAKYGR